MEVDPKKPKYYVLDMFPYPSGHGLHVGHPQGYTATDTVCRYKRMQGFNVLHPMGWDSFGLPTENYAIKTGVHPRKITEKNIATFKRQLKSLGFSYDWGRELATSDVDYYKWTQWIFIQLYRKGLAYEDEIEVNWCPALKTVLANEEVVDGQSEVGGHPVEQRKMKQWMLKITEYAERLLEDLEDLHWPESVKEMQRNWIGKSTGATCTFSPGLEIFTTRPDTLFGVTYVVLAPEHPMMANDILPLVTGEQRAAVEEYLKETKKKSNLERTDLNKDKTGVFTGAYAINPVNGKRVPIWVADYVLATYGTGAIMAVPAHDQRDWEFAKKFNLPLVQVISGGDVTQEAHVGDGILLNSGPLNGLSKEEAITQMISWLEEKKLGQKKVHYKLRDWIFSRQRYWGEPFPLVKFEDGTVRCLDESELPIALPEVEHYGPSGTGESPLATIGEWTSLIDAKTGRKGQRETHTMPNWAGSCWYYLRFCDPTNDKRPWDRDIERYWMPVNLYVGGVEHAVLHLLYARFWHKVLFDLDLVSTKEPFQKLVNQGLILGSDGEKMSKSRGNVANIDPVVKKYGADALRLYEMFMGPLEKVKPWQEKGIKGVFAFVSKAFLFFGHFGHFEHTDWKREEDRDVLKLLHKTIKKVGEDIERMRFNTAISQMMIFTNFTVKKGKVAKSTAETFTLLLSPFAPHAAEELWHRLGHSRSLAYEDWPVFDPQWAKDDLITIALQVNGKTRDTIDVPEDISKEDCLAQAKCRPKIAKYLERKCGGEGQNPLLIKEIYVPRKIINFVVKETRA